MAIRNIVQINDLTLRKKSFEVTEFNEKLHMLLDDMKETLLRAEGVGLAAPQVGVLRRAVIVLETNVDDDEDEYFIELVNPEIVETSGEQTGDEGCLSLPGKSGTVTRPNIVTVNAYNEHMEPFTLTGEGLLARAICHECDHLDGIMYVEHVEGELHDVQYEEQEEDE